MGNYCALFFFVGICSLYHVFVYFLQNKALWECNRLITILIKHEVANGFLPPQAISSHF